MDSLGFFWIPSSDSCLFKGLRAIQAKKCWRLRRRQSSSAQPKIRPRQHLAKVLEPQLARTPPSPFHASLAFRPDRGLSVPWISTEGKNKTGIFWRRKLAPDKRDRKARDQEAAQADKERRALALCACSRQTAPPPTSELGERPLWCGELPHAIPFQMIGERLGGARLASGYRQSGRSPPTVNAFLNYAYAVLQSEVQIKAVADGYDPMLGIMHYERDGSPAFVFDLMVECELVKGPQPDPRLSCDAAGSLGFVASAPRFRRRGGGKFCHT